MNKRIWSIAIALAMLLSMVCSVFVVSAAETQAAVQIEEEQIEEQVVAGEIELSQEAELLNAAGDLPTLALATESEDITVGNEFDVALSLENYTGDWATFTATLTYDAAGMEYVSYTEAETDETDESPKFSVVEFNAETGTLTITWLNGDGVNVTTTGTIPLMSLKFRAIGASDEPIAAAFAEESVARYNTSTGEPELVEASAYTASATLAIAIEKKVPYLTTRLVDENGESITEIEQGQSLKAIITLHNFYDGWMFVNLSTTYDSSRLVLNGVEDLGAFPGELMWAEPTTGTLNFFYTSGGMENMLMQNEQGETVYEADILELSLTVKALAEEGAASVSTSFAEGNYKYDAANDTEVELVAGNDKDYIETHYNASASVSVGETARPYLELEIPDQKKYKQGESFTLNVMLKNFKKYWSAMTPIVQFDQTVFELDDTAVTQGVFGDYAMPYISGGTLGVTLLSESGDVGLTGGATEGLLFSVPVTVRTDATLSTDTFNFSVFFAPEGNYSGGAVVDKDFYETNSKETANTLEVKVQGNPSLSIRRTDGLNTVINQGDTVQFTVSANNFIGAWQIMTLMVKYDTGVFELVEDSVTDLKPFADAGADDFFTPEYDKTKSYPLLACWFNTADRYMLNSTQDVMTFTLKATKYVELTEDASGEKAYPISVAFVPGGNYAEETELTEEQYSADAAIVNVTVKEVAAEVLVKIEWGAMEFTYNFGTWEPNEHIWDGRGWSVASDADKTITVTNQGGVAITAEFAFAESLTGMVGKFYDSENAEVTQPLTIDAPADDAEGVSKAVTLGLSDLPDGAELSTTEKTPLGTIKITIDKADS